MVQDKSRRDILKIGVAAAAGLGVASCSDISGFAGTGDGYDAIVVGAGFAGATAARELAAAGLRVMVLEARNRLGGRTFTTEFAGREVELGGKWIHWLQPHIWSEVDRYGLQLTESPVAAPERVVAVNRDGERSEGDIAATIGAFTNAYNRFCEDARTLFPRPFDPLFNEAVREADALSVQDRLDQLGLPPDEEDVMLGAMTGLAGAPLSDFAYTMLVRNYAAGGWNFDSFFDALTRYAFKDGTIGCLKAMLASDAIEVQTGAPVTKIADRGDEVIVTVDGNDTVSARACIVTIPLNTYGYIEFEPGLPSGKQTAVDLGQASRGVKFYAHVEENLGQVMGMGSPLHTPMTWMQTEEYGDDGTILICFGYQDDALNINDSASLANAVNLFLPDVTVLSTAGYDWNADPFSQGTWPTLRPGQLSAHLDDLKASQGNLFFAGGVTGGWTQFIDGAVESGLRTSRELLQHLG